MKRQWTADDLAEHWTLAGGDTALLANKTGATRLGFAVLLKYFQYEGRFPHHKGDIPAAAIVHVAQQLELAPPVCMGRPDGRLPPRPDPAGARLPRVHRAGQR